MERLETIVLVGGLGFFVLAALIMGVWPYTLLKDVPVQSLEEISQQVHPSFHDLAKRYPESFADHYGEPDSESYARALELGRRTYIAEGCWHCHSQQIRPVSNEDLRWGPVSRAGEYQNVMHLPQLLGTRRVGPDLSRESGRRSNDWHAAHFYEPTWVVPTSVMPSYRWFYEERPGPDGEPHPVPNAKGLAMIAYMQWLGSWADSAMPPTFYGTKSILEDAGR